MTSPSSSACATTPAGPTSLSLTQLGDQSILLAWTDNSAIEDGYEVWQVWTCSSICDAWWLPQYGPLLVAELPPNATSLTTPALLSGYWVYVVAKKDGAESDPVGMLVP